MIAQPAGFADLSKAEQIRYLMDLWDQVLDSPGHLPAPDSHLDLAAARLAAFRNDPAQARPAHEVLDRLSARAR